MKPEDLMSAAKRFDLYVGIHKALRFCMNDTMQKIGTLDRDDTTQVVNVLTQLRELLQFCRTHVEMENRHIHPAIEARQPGAATLVENEHLQHIQACQHLSRQADQVALTEGAEREAAIERLYRYLGLFIADNLLHMNSEETEHNAALWASYSDAELRALHQAMTATLSAQDKSISLRWMLPALNPAERLALMGALRTSMPPNAFVAMLQMGEKILSAQEWRKLNLGLAKQDLVTA